jgi:serine/threonine protein kinase
VADPTESSIVRLPPEIHDDETFQRKYLIERELGVGGAGVVVCARHRELDERVAIKFLLPGKTNSDAVARFRREARAANRVKDEHVVRIIDVSTTATGVPYVVMEYLDGVDLERMLLQSPERQLPVPDAIEFILQACEALAECHRSGIVHRDLKPSNLFCVQGVDGSPLIKVLDFGISKLNTTTVDGVMTAEHLIMGSPRYMSPEQFASASEVDHRTDVWALGIILYELVTGEVPFADSTLLKIWDKVRSAALRPLEELRRDAPSALNAVLAKCLAKEPGDRYQNVAELARALAPFAPERGRASVARVVRIVESERGVTTPPVSRERTEDAPSDAPTIVSAGGDVRQRPKRRPFVPLVALGAVVAVAAWSLWPEKTVEAPSAPSAQLPIATAAKEAPPNPSPERAVVTPIATADVAPTDVSLSSEVPRSKPASSPRQSAFAPRTTAVAPASPATVTASSTAEVVDEAVPPPVVSAEPPPAVSAAPAASASGAPVSSTRRSGPEYLMDIVERRRPSANGAP